MKQERAPLAQLRIKTRKAAQTRKHGDNAAKEDHFAAVLAEEVLPQFHFALI